jgi:DNA-binding transcriptional MerR regulator
MPGTKRNSASNQSKQQAKYTMAIAVMITGVPAHRIRRFEEFGLCKPIRSKTGHRLFSDIDVEVIKRISVLERDGVNLPGVKIIFSMTSVFKNVNLDSGIGGEE